LLWSTYWWIIWLDFCLRMDRDGLDHSVKPNERSLPSTIRLYNCYLIRQLTYGENLILNVNGDEGSYSSHVCSVTALYKRYDVLYSFSYIICCNVCLLIHGFYIKISFRSNNLWPIVVYSTSPCSLP
jgi:hypothetical protein